MAQRWVARDFGGLDVLDLVPVDVPPPGPGEGWFWDYVEGEFADGPPLAAPSAHPADQPVPGPAGRVPADWMKHLH